MQVTLGVYIRGSKMLKKLSLAYSPCVCTTVAWTEEVVDCNDRRQNYLTIAQAQAVLLPGVQLTQQEVTLSQEHIQQIEDTADVTIYTDKLAVWQAQIRVGLLLTSYR